MAKTSVIAGQMSGNKKIRDIEVFSNSIAHELRGYFARVGICVRLSEKNLSDINKTIKDANNLLNSIQLQIRGIISNDQGLGHERYLISRSIEDVLKPYPFKKDERDLISVETDNDFEYFGNPILIARVLYNLISNALRAIKSANKGCITIRLEVGTEFNKLIFMDTAAGIPKDFLQKMFKLFESQNKHQGGTGVGLAFCKSAMKSCGGDITCKSVKGEYTEFMLSFPSLK